MNECSGRVARRWPQPCPNRADCGQSASKAHGAAHSCSDKYSRALLTLEPRSGTLKLLTGQIFILKTMLPILIDCGFQGKLLQLIVKNARFLSRTQIIRLQESLGCLSAVHTFLRMIYFFFLLRLASHCLFICPAVNLPVIPCRWLVLAMAMMRFYVQKGTHKGLYRSIARTLKFFQTFALVEVRAVEPQWFLPRYSLKQST